MSSKFGLVLANNTTMRLVAYNILHNKYFFYRAIDFIDIQYFKSSNVVQAFFTIVLDYYDTTNAMIGFNTLIAEINSRYHRTDFYDDLINFVNISNSVNELVEVEYLVGMLEKLIKNDLITNEAMNVAKIIKDYDDDKVMDVAEKFEDITSIRFQADEFESFIDSSFDVFYENMTTSDDRLEFLLKALNDTTDGGVRRGTLNTVIGGTGAGKTLTMLSLFMDYLLQGYNCAYISLELSAIMIKERFNANRLDVDLSDMKNHEYSTVTKEDWRKKWDNPFKKFTGKQFLKASEPHAYSAKDIEKLVQRYEKLNNCKIDVIFIDHLSLMKTYGSVRDRSQTSLYGQAQAEEAITLAKRLGVAVWTGAQFNRGAMGDKDSDMSGIAGSIGVTHASDFVMSIHVDKENGAILGRKHKSRYSDVSMLQEFLLGIDRARQRLYNFDGRSADMTNFDAEYEEAKRQSANVVEDGKTSLYFDDSEFERIINSDTLDEEAVKELANNIYEGTPVAITPKTTKVETSERKRAFKFGN